MRSDFLFLIGSLKKGGAERNTALLANHLVREGHTVKLLTFTSERAFELDPRIHQELINYKRFAKGWLNFLYVLTVVFFKVWSIRPKRFITMSRIAGLFASVTLYPKTIVRFDIYPLIGYREYKKWQFWILYNMPWVKYVVCPSGELRDDVARYFLNSKKLAVIYNPVPQVGRSVKSEVVKHSRPYFIIVSRLHDQKNVDKVVQTFYDHEVFKRADLLIAGDGPEMQRLQAQVNALRMKDNIRLMGFIQDPHPYIEHAIALINASLREGFPNVVVEALSLGTPVLSSKAKTGPKEIIFEGENGFLFEVGDYKRLGSLMNTLLDSPELYRHLKQNTNKGLERFSYDAVLKSWGVVLH